MKIFILPGNDISNRDWADRIQPMLGQAVGETKVQQYQHWIDGTPSININKEVAVLLESLNEQQEPYGIFAKSAGILVALEALAECDEPPAFAIFAGLPLKLAEQQEIDIVELLDSVDYPVLFIQNAYDPAGTAEEVRRLTTRVEHAEFALLPGNSHDYPIVGNTLAAIEDFIAENK